MFTSVLKLYEMYMMTSTTNLLPHLEGPPGSGKSSVVRQVAEAEGVTMHTLNVSRVNPLGLEGLDVPNQDHSGLNLLTASVWTKLHEGDILLLDEFLRGFPEVYNGLLDILTSREVAGFQLPKVFFIAASNSTVAYDSALEDRLLHMPVPDPRKSSAELQALKQRFIAELGLFPELITDFSLDQLFRSEVLPTYDILDQFQKQAHASAATLRGSSMRHLIGQVQLRRITSSALKAVLETNNTLALAQGKMQYVVLPDGNCQSNAYIVDAPSLRNNSRMTQLQLQNLEQNLALIEMEKLLQNSANQSTEDEEETDNDPVIW